MTSSTAPSTGLTLPPTDFQCISPVLDKEHTEIFKAIDKLYAVCEKHWHTEDALFKEGLSDLPKDHKRVKRLVNNHRKHHSDALKSIIEMKVNIMNHINEEDTQHFHWIP